MERLSRRRGGWRRRNAQRRGLRLSGAGRKQTTERKSNASGSQAGRAGGDDHTAPSKAARGTFAPTELLLLQLEQQLLLLLQRHDLLLRRRRTAARIGLIAAGAGHHCRCR